MGKTNKEEISVVYDIEDSKFKKKILQNAKLVEKTTKKISNMGTKVNTAWITKLKTNLTKIKGTANKAKTSVENIWKTVKLTWLTKARSKINKVKLEAKTAKDRIEKMGSNVNTSGIDSLLLKIWKVWAAWAALTAWAAWAFIYGSTLDREDFIQNAQVQKGKSWAVELVNTVDMIKRETSLIDYWLIADSISSAISLGITDKDVLKGLAISWSNWTIDTNIISKAMNGLKNAYVWTTDEQAFETIRYLEQKTGDKSWEIAENLLEYAPFFKNAGYSLEETAKMFTIWVKNGIYQTDKIWDVIKEQSFKFSDQSEKQDFDIFNKIWLSWEKLFKDLQAWTTNTKELNRLFLTQLDKSKISEVDKNGVLMELFGSQWEDVSPKILKAILKGSQTWDTYWQYIKKEKEDTLQDILKMDKTWTTTKINSLKKKVIWEAEYAGSIISNTLGYKTKDQELKNLGSSNNLMENFSDYYGSTVDAKGVERDRQWNIINNTTINNNYVNLQDKNQTTKNLNQIKITEWK